MRGTVYLEWPHAAVIERHVWAFDVEAAFEFEAAAIDKAREMAASLRGIMGGQRFVISFGPIGRSWR